MKWQTIAILLFVEESKKRRYHNMKLDTRIKELIAVGASVTANCQPCLQYHVSKAREAGANDEDIACAMTVAQVVRKGAAAKMDDFAAGLGAATATAECGAGQGCGCAV
jgi:AhpD family alkylhydroperoxidase